MHQLPDASAHDIEHRRRYASAIRSARETGADAFQSWFDNAASEEAALRQGYWDFSFHILTPAVVARLRDPGALTAVEIGCGGGRLLNAAAGFFGHVVGIDVHDDLDAVADVLRRYGRTNVTLLPTDGSSIPIEDGSAGFVYSFIVLQHLPRSDAFVRYLHETRRVLAPGGVAQLYYGRLRTRNPRSSYREIDVPVNHTSLELSSRHVRRLCRSHGLAVVAEGTSYKRVPDGFPRTPGGQGYVTLAKNA